MTCARPAATASKRKRPSASVVALAPPSMATLHGGERLLRAPVAHLPREDGGRRRLGPENELVAVEDADGRGLAVDLRGLEDELPRSLRRGLVEGRARGLR